eukprot:TRINITY_DN17848_c0_g1_i1.p1 TRINITY_DN17848_c0_g1~~TRINITY_DN17848_c0_g1_i1.p1  ORF type:complete len:290 (-),score=42.38 TRINITY_DN17848_c0_g1_i1:330-1199(-)
MGIPTGGLIAAQKAAYDQDGFLLLEDFVSLEECERLKQRAEELVADFDPKDISIFSTKNQKQHTDGYFYKSAGNISFFFEEKAFDEKGQLVQPKALSINKIGHALHDLDPAFRSFSRSEKVAAVMASLGYKRPLPVQSMYIFKQPGIGGEVVPHQDNTFLYTDPPSVVAFWVALEDATKGNGCLWALPGSHKEGNVRRFIRTDNGVHFDKDMPHYDVTQMVPIEARAGSVVLLDGSLIHMSHENQSPKSRHAYTVHVIEGQGSKWAEDNWLQRPEDFPFEALYEEATLR